MKRSVWGVILIALGLMATLQSIDPVRYHFGLAFWPVLWVMAGGSILYSAFRRTSWFGMAVGLYLGAMGLADILHNAGVFTFDGGDILAKGWPLILVAIGVSILFGKANMSWSRDGRRRKFQFETGGRSWTIGDIRQGYGDPWQLNEDLELNRGIGDIKLDLTTAEILPGTYRINVHGGIGDVMIRVPDNVNCSVVASAGIGDVEVFGEFRSGLGLSVQKRIVVPDSPVELEIECRHAIGDVRIVHGPATVRLVR
jgi:lia operon protein LiaF